ncbi:MAG: hypothetical protein ACRELB_20135 [Polyangiaceae bacterium]
MARRTVSDAAVAGDPAASRRALDDNHWVLEPAQSRRWHEEVLAWIDRYTMR